MVRMFCVFVLCWLSASPVLADELSGPAMVTVSGKISNPNREALDAFHDIYFNIQDVEFSAATEFDLASLQALGMRSVSASYEDWPGKIDFEGPLLSDVLKQAGATGSIFSVKALDGYTVDVSREEIEKYPVVLAIKANGKFLGIGGRGPAWLIFPRDDYEDLAKEDDSKFVWAVYHIEVK